MEEQGLRATLQSLCFAVRKVILNIDMRDIQCNCFIMLMQGHKALPKTA